MLKEHKEFYTIDTKNDWEPVPGYPKGITQKILTGHLDEVNNCGTRSRLLKFEPGAFTTVPFRHDYWEEVFLASGNLTVGGVTYNPMTYACRPPDAYHGPFKSDEGCILFEIHYFNPLTKEI